MSLPNTITQLLSNKEQMDLNQKIFEEIFTDTNLDRKTELQYPIKWSLLSILKDYLKSKGLDQSSLILDSFITISFKYLISKDRKGRSEYIQALQALKAQQENQISEKNDVVNMAVRK